MMNQPTLCLSERDVELLLGGEMPPSELSATEEHLADCQSCRRAIEASLGGRQWWDELEESLHAAAAPCVTEWDDTEDASKQLLDLLGPTDDPAMLGRIGPYEVVGILGRGGMGAVFKAFDPALNRYVAVKMLLPHLSASGAARNRFAREAQAAAAIIDDHVMAIHSVSAWQGIPYFVMPYTRGSSLQKRLNEQGPLQLREILRIGSQVASGLAAAHAQGIVHRDVKPANIFSEDGVERVQLMDFGLARAVDDASLTRTGILAGTPQYMAPEQARAESVDARSDQFSLGAVLYALCTGRPPFRADSAYGVLRLITDENPRPIREINPDIPDWLCAIIGKLMAKQPGDRFESTQDVAKLLEDCLAHIQQPAAVVLPKGVPVPEPAGSSKPEDPPEVPSSPAAMDANRRNSWPRIAALTCLFTGVVLAGIVIYIEFDKGTIRIETDAEKIHFPRGGEPRQADKSATKKSVEPVLTAKQARMMKTLKEAEAEVARLDQLVKTGQASKASLEQARLRLRSLQEAVQQTIDRVGESGDARPRIKNGEPDDSLAADLELLQGSWELLHGNEGKGPPNTRSVKTIEGNIETLRRYSIKSGKKLREHRVEFQLSKSGNSRMLTFYPVGGTPEQGQSYFYKVDKNNFYDITGLIHGKDRRNYQTDVNVWHWKRVKPEKKGTAPPTSDQTSRKSTPQTHPLSQIREAWKQRASRVDSSVLEWTENRIYPKGEFLSPNDSDPLAEDRTITWQKKLILSRGRYRLEGLGQTVYHDKEMVPFKFTAVKNKTSRSYHDYPERTDNLGYIRNSFAELPDVTYRPALVGVNPGDPELGRIKLDDYHVVAGIRDVAGRPCILLESNDKHRELENRLYLDPKRQYAVTRIVSSSGNTITRQLDMSYKRDAHGVWYPSSWQFQIINGTGTGHALHIAVVTARFDSQHKAAAEDFEIKYRQGMQVYDLRTATRKVSQIGLAGRGRPTRNKDRSQSPDRPTIKTAPGVGTKATIPNDIAPLIPWQDTWKVIRTEYKAKEFHPGLSGQITTPLEIEVRGFEIDVGWSNGSKTNGTLQLDFDKEPPVFKCDWLIPLYGIYRIEPDRLAICYNPSGMPHAETPPGDFSTTADSDRVLCVFERQSTRQYREAANELAKLRRREKELLSKYSADHEQVKLCRRKLALETTRHQQILTTLEHNLKQSQLAAQAAAAKLSAAIRKQAAQPVDESELEPLQQAARQARINVIRAQTLAGTAKAYLHVRPIDRDAADLGENILLHRSAVSGSWKISPCSDAGVASKPTEQQSKEFHDLQAAIKALRKQLDEPDRVKTNGRGKADDARSIKALSALGAELEIHAHNGVTRVVQVTLGIGDDGRIGGAKDAHLARLTGLHSVQRLVIAGRDVTDAGLANLGHLTRLSSLQLANAPITDKGLVVLAKWNRLTDLGLAGSKVTGTGLIHLSGKTRLAVLNLNNAAATDEGFKQIAKLRNLRELYLAKTAITDEGLKAIPALSGLQTLVLMETATSDAGLDKIAALSKLTSLDLGRTRVTDDGLASLSKLTKLQTLTLAGTRIADRGLKSLIPLTKLKRLDVRRTQVSDDGVAVLRKAIPDCVILTD